MRWIVALLGAVVAGACLAIAGVWDDQQLWQRGQVPPFVAVLVLGGAVVGVVAIFVSTSKTD